MLKAFTLPEFIADRLSLDATLRGSGLALATLLRHWQGDGTLTTDDAHLEGLNIAQLVQIPRHIYSDWQQLNYQLNVEQALRGSLEQEARDALRKSVEAALVLRPERALLPSSPRGQRVRGDIQHKNIPWLTLSSMA